MEITVTKVQSTEQSILAEDLDAVPVSRAVVSIFQVRERRVAFSRNGRLD